MKKAEWVGGITLLAIMVIMALLLVGMSIGQALLR